MKQICNHKFYDIDANTVKVLYPSGETKVLSKKDSDALYKRLYAFKNADTVFDKTLKELGLNLKTAHLLTYDSYLTDEKGEKLIRHYANGMRTTSPRDIFSERMEKNLRIAKVDLSFDSVITMKYDVKIGGNAGGIASDYSTFLFRSPWRDCSMTKDELKVYLKKHPKVRVFESYKYDIKEVSRERVLEVVFGTKDRHIGMGSQASVHSTTVKLKKDDKGNLYISEFTMIWD